MPRENEHHDFGSCDRGRCYGRHVSGDRAGLDGRSCVMGVRFVSATANEVLDSRSRPTLAVHLLTAEGRGFSAGVPSGASTGSREAVELRDGDDARYGGQGVLGAVRNVNEPIAELLTSRVFESLEDLDRAMIELDGTDDKSSLGANAIVGVSMAAARAFAAADGTPLWRFLGPADGEPRMPVPHFNVLNGGVHAANDLDFQEFMIAPLGAPSAAEAVRAGSEIYGHLKSLLRERGHEVGLGDEGGFAPEIADPADVLQLVADAIEGAGYTAGRDGVAIALDPASSEFEKDCVYRVAGRDRSSDEMIDYYAELVDRFPIWSIEDGLSERDRDGWRRLTERLGERVQLVGDDLFVTNPAIVRDAIADGIANAALIKVNQIGTVTETLETLAVCREGDYAAMVSHRSGESDDSFIADLAVASACGQIKSGAPARGERIAKYNRLVEIEALRARE
ncbi:phosphopyruvate hydratase [Rhodococcus rhodnii LMG 5362]|uniref:Enolase n=2 Tax=Rhodococcus rhodnii TaxID=38312 RepID=R7WMM0_9NOCA|nr:phosphopyruvate hydratase [Rhodococcus rhodnii LMG 5362]